MIRFTGGPRPPASAFHSMERRSSGCDCRWSTVKWLKATKGSDLSRAARTFVHVRAVREGGLEQPNQGKMWRGKPVYLVLTMDDSTGLLSQLVAIPLRQFELDGSLSYVVLLGASRTALAKLPVYVGDQSHRSVTSHLS
jgi:hypothetical protein